MIINYIDHLLLILKLPVDKTTAFEQFTYTNEAILVFALAFLVLTIIIQIFRGQLHFSAWMFVFLLAAMVYGTLYWAALKIPYTVMQALPFLMPKT